MGNEKILLENFVRQLELFTTAAKPLIRGLGLLAPSRAVHSKNIEELDSLYETAFSHYDRNVQELLELKDNNI